MMVLLRIVSRLKDKIKYKFNLVITFLYIIKLLIWNKLGSQISLLGKIIYLRSLFWETARNIIQLFVNMIYLI
jgi:hypothetical protein